MSDTKLAYGIDEACSALSIRPTLLHDLIRRKQIASIKVGRRRLITAMALQAYLDRLASEQKR